MRKRQRQRQRQRETCLTEIKRQSIQPSKLAREQSLPFPCQAPQGCKSARSPTIVGRQPRTIRGCWQSAGSALPACKSYQLLKVITSAVGLNYIQQQHACRRRRLPCPGQAWARCHRHTQRAVARYRISCYFMASCCVACYCVICCCIGCYCAPKTSLSTTRGPAALQVGPPGKTVESQGRSIILGPASPPGRPNAGLSARPILQLGTAHSQDAGRSRRSITLMER